MSVNTEHEIEGTISDNRSYHANVCVDWDAIDDGIGPYEFWGTDYVDVHNTFECAGFFVENISVYTDDGDEVVVDLINNEENRKNHPELWDEIIVDIEGDVILIDAPENMVDDEYDEY